MKTLTQILKQTAKKILAPALISIPLMLGLQGTSCLNNPNTSTSSSTSTSTTQEKKYHVSGNLTDILTETPIQGAKVNLDYYSVKTNSNGDYDLQVPRGSYDLTVSASGYYEKESSLPVYADSTNNNFELIPDSVNKEHFKRVFQSYNGSTHAYPNVGVTQRILDADCAVWEVYINSSTAWPHGTPITTEMIDKVVNILEGNDSRTGWQHLYEKGKLHPTIAKGRIHKGKNPPEYWTPRTTIIEWDDSLEDGGAMHFENLKEGTNEIESSVIELHPNAVENAISEELYQVIGARSDSDIEQPSIVNQGTDAYPIQRSDINNSLINSKVPPGTTLFN